MDCCFPVSGNRSAGIQTIAVSEVATTINLALVVTCNHSQPHRNGDTSRIWRPRGVTRLGEESAGVGCSTYHPAMAMEGVVGEEGGNLLLKERIKNAN